MSNSTESSIRQSVNNAKSGIEEFWDTHQGAILGGLFDFLISCALLWFGWKISRWVTNFLRKTMIEKFNVDQTISGFFCNALKLVLRIVIVILVMGVIGIEADFFVGITSAAVLGLAFGFQGTLQNFLAGLILLFFRPFKVGDFVNVCNGIYGEVVEIQVLFTILDIAGGGHLAVLNNYAVTSAPIHSYSKRVGHESNDEYGHDVTAVELVIGIGPDDDINVAKETAFKIIDADDRFSTEENTAKAIWIDSWDAQGCKLMIRAFCKPECYWQCRHDLIENIYVMWKHVGLTITSMSTLVVKTGALPAPAQPQFEADDPFAPPPAAQGGVRKRPNLSHRGGFHAILKAGGPGVADTAINTLSMGLLGSKKKKVKGNQVVPEDQDAKSQGKYEVK